MIKEIEQKIQFERFSGCFWCGVPQEICNRWEDNGQGRYQRAAGGRCQYYGVLLGGLLGVVYGSEAWVAKHWTQRLVEEGIGGSSVEDLIEYLAGKQAIDCVESNRLVGEFCWVTRLVDG